MKRKGIACLAALVALSTVVCADTVDGESVSIGALVVGIEGPARFQSGNLDRLLIDLTAVNPTGESIRVSLPFAEEYVVVEDVGPGEYVVTDARYGYPDGSSIGGVALPGSTITVSADSVTIAPFLLTVDGGGAAEVSWRSVEVKTRTAIYDSVSASLR